MSIKYVRDDWLSSSETHQLQESHSRIDRNVHEMSECIMCIEYIRQNDKRKKNKRIKRSKTNIEIALVVRYERANFDERNVVAFLPLSLCQINCSCVYSVGWVKICRPMSTRISISIDPPNSNVDWSELLNCWIASPFRLQSLAKQIHLNFAQQTICFDLCRAAFAGFEIIENNLDFIENGV